MPRKASTLILQITVLALLGAVLFLNGCDSLYRMLDKEGAEEKELVGEVVPFEHNPTIQEGQALLEVYGYHVGAVDGVLGVHTRNAIEKFQKDNGFKTSRFLDKTTWARLQAPVTAGLVVDNELDIVRIQETLQKAGFNPGTIDGKVGPKTTAAVKMFQQAHSLKVDGKIGFQTLFALSQVAAP